MPKLTVSQLAHLFKLWTLLLPENVRTDANSAQHACPGSINLVPATSQILCLRVKLQEVLLLDWEPVEAWNIKLAEKTQNSILEGIIQNNFFSVFLHFNVIGWIVIIIQIIFIGLQIRNFCKTFFLWNCFYFIPLLQINYSTCKILFILCMIVLICSVKIITVLQKLKIN